MASYFLVSQTTNAISYFYIEKVIKLRLFLCLQMYKIKYSNAMTALNEFVKD